jgi:tRNA-2-methylthio-N6-dimethylallyladenosine synthase
MNEHDSEKMSGTLEGLGYEPASAPELADVLLLNTCAIREKAEEKIYSYLAKIAPHKKARPEMIVGVAGCVGQMSGETIRERAPSVDLVFGPRATSRLPDLLAKVHSERGVVDTTLYQEGLFPEEASVRRDPSRVKAYVTVMEGCNKTCTYCIVPTTRGREVSRTLEHVLDEVVALARQGYGEIELLGQNVNAWRCPETKAGFDHLLRATARAEGIRRIRFTTSHPLHFRTPIMQAMAETPEVCNYLHLPVQSGSSAVLAAMRRGYDRENYLARIAELRDLIPDVVLSTDVIVGFPGETDEDFEETLSLVETVGFDQMFSFVYSPRPGTMASMMRDELPAEVKSERLTRLQSRQREIQKCRNEARVGREELVVVTGPSRKDPDEWAGRTDGNQVVNFPGRGFEPGDEVRVRLVAAGFNSFRGEVSADALAS